MSRSIELNIGTDNNQQEVVAITLIGKPCRIDDFIMELMALSKQYRTKPQRMTIDSNGKPKPCGCKDAQ